MRTLSQAWRGRALRGIGAVAVPDASAAITAGQNTFNQAYAMANGSLEGTAAVAAGIVANLPKGQLSSALSQAMSVGASAEAGAAIGSVIPGYGTAIGAVVGAIVGIVSTITGSNPPNPTGEFRSAAERYCFPALPLTPTVGESPSALAQTLLQPVVWPTYRANAVSWMPVTTDTDLGDPFLNQTKPVEFTFGVGWVSPPSSTAASTAQGYYCACAWMASNGVSRAQGLAHDDSAGDLRAFASAAKNQAITALGSEDLFNQATDLFRSWYGLGGWSTKADGNLSGPTWPPNSGAWSKYLPIWQSIHHQLRQPSGAADWTYYTGNYILETIGSSPWMVDSVDETWFNEQTHERSGEGWGATFNIAPLPDTTAIALFELACLAVTQVIPREGADVAALHFLLGYAWMWRRGYETDKARNKTIQQVYGIDTGIQQATFDNFSRCIGLVQAKIRAANKKATATAVKETSSSVKAAETQILASEKAVAAAQASATRAAQAPPPAPELAPSSPPAPGLSNEQIAVGAVVLAAAMGGAVLYKRRKRSYG